MGNNKEVSHTHTLRALPAGSSAKVGEIATFLTILTLGMMFVGTIIGARTTVSKKLRSYRPSAQTTGCSYHTRVVLYQDRVGNSLNIPQNEIDQGMWGVSNDKQSQVTPAGRFNSDGQYEFQTNNLASSAIRNNASVKLFFNDQSWKITNIFCSPPNNPGTPGCPTDFPTQPKNTSTISNFNVACRVDIEYGWVLKALSSAGTTGDMEVKVIALDTPQKTGLFSSSKPASCKRDDSDGRPLYLSNLKVTATGPVTRTVAMEKNKGYISFHDLPVGSYTLSVSGISDRGFSIWEGCGDKQWTVTGGGTVASGNYTRAIVPLQNRSDGVYETENSESSCTNTIKDETGQRGVSNLIQGVRGSFCYYGELKPTGGAGCWCTGGSSCAIAGGTGYTPNYCSAPGDVLCCIGGAQPNPEQRQPSYCCSADVHCSAFPARSVCGGAGTGPGCDSGRACVTKPTKTPQPTLRPVIPTSIKTRCEREDGVCMDKFSCQSNGGTTDGIKECTNNNLCCKFSRLSPTPTKTILPITPPRVTTLVPSIEPITIQPTIALPTNIPPEELTCIPLKSDGNRRIVIIGDNFGKSKSEFLGIADKVVDAFNKSSLPESVKGNFSFYALNPEKTLLDPFCGNINGAPICDPVITNFARAQCSGQYHIVVVNQTADDGILGAVNLYGTVTVVKNHPEISIHEFGHAIAGLADEYVSNGGFKIEFLNPPNCSYEGTTNQEEVCKKWSRDFPKQNYPLMGCFPGCNYVETQFRPSDKSIMHADLNNTGFNPPSIQAWKEKVGSGFADLQYANRDESYYHNGIKVQLVKNDSNQITLKELSVNQIYPLSSNIMSENNYFSSFGNKNSHLSLSVNDKAGKSLFETSLTFEGFIHGERYQNNKFIGPINQPYEVKEIATYLPLLKNATKIEVRDSNDKLVLEKKLDPTEIKPIENQNLCGNGICDTRNGENINSCRDDCKQSSKQFKSSDFNNDGTTNALDFALVIANERRNPFNLKADINGDGAVNALDASIVLANL